MFLVCFLSELYFILQAYFFLPSVSEVSNSKYQIFAYVTDKDNIYLAASNLLQLGILENMVPTSATMLFYLQGTFPDHVMSIRCWDVLTSFNTTTITASILSADMSLLPAVLRHYSVFVITEV